jgi:hypothetical protein
MVARHHRPENEMSSLRFHMLASLGALAAGCAIATSPAAMAASPAAEAHKEAAHDHGAAMPSKLSLDHGRKWATDPALRSGMERIRGIVEPQLGAAHGGKLSTAQYAALAGKIETEVGGIVADCKLEPKADAMLHLVIGEIGAGTDAMAGKAAKTKPQQGLVHIAAAVNNYGKYFEHPGFKPIPVGH